MEIRLSRGAEKALDKLDEKARNRVMLALTGLEQEPQTGQIRPLIGVNGVMRVRVGDYRIIFENHADYVHIIKIATRGDVYKGL